MNEPTVIQPRGPTEIGPGLRLNETYEIVELVGEGGLSQVYRAFNIRNRHPVAIKFMRADLLGDADTMELFQREASILAELSHDAIVRYLGFSFDPLIRREYLVMEFVQGLSLEVRLRQKPLSTAEGMTLKARLAGGLSAAHRRGAVHRDMSPDNVILPGGDIENAKIIDFGIAKALKFAGHTVIGSGIAGKFSYMSPEQVFGGEIAEKSDVYSLGLVLAAALRGEPLDMGKTLAELAPKRSSIPDLGSVDPVLRPLIQRMLRPNPAERPSMDEVAVWQPEAARGARDRASGEPSAPSRVGAIAAALGAFIICASLAATGFVFRDDLRGLVARGGSQTTSPSRAEADASPSPAPLPEIAAKTEASPSATPEPEALPSPLASTSAPPPSAEPTPATPIVEATPTPAVTASPIVAVTPPPSPASDLEPTPTALPAPMPSAAAIASPSPPAPTFSAPVPEPKPAATGSPAPTRATVAIASPAAPAPTFSPPILAPPPTTFASPAPPTPAATVAVAMPANEPPRAPAVLITLNTAYVGRPFRQTFAPFESADPEGLRISTQGHPPAGLVVTDAGRGAAVVEGTPTRSGSTAFAIVATDRNKRTTTMHTIAIVVDPPSAVVSPNLPAAHAPAPSPAPPAAPAKPPAAPTGVDLLASLLKRYETDECWLARNSSPPGEPPRVEAISGDATELTYFAEDVARRLGGTVALERVAIDRPQCPALALARVGALGPRLELAARSVGGAVPLGGAVRGLGGRALTVLVVRDDGKTISIKPTLESGDAARFNLDITKVDDEDVGRKLVVAAIVSPRPLPSLREAGADQPRPILSLGAAGELFAKLAAEASEAGASADIEFVTLVRP